MKTLKEILDDRQRTNEETIRAAQALVERVLIDMRYGDQTIGIADKYFYVKTGPREHVEVHPNKIRVTASDVHRAGAFNDFEWCNTEVFCKLLEWQIVELDNDMSVLDYHPLHSFAERLARRVGVYVPSQVDEEGEDLAEQQF